ncbi:MAG: IS66 family transposase zinc-finger binding domain-containing protein [Hyphomicrobiaceae bacterium]
MCPCGSGQTRPRIGEIVTEQADIVPAKVVVLQHVRFKYGPCRQRRRVPIGGGAVGEGRYRR